MQVKYLSQRGHPKRNIGWPQALFFPGKDQF
jgi:hypothetical protein